MKVQLHSFLASALVAGSWSSTCLVPFIAGIHFIGGWVRPTGGKGVWDKRKLSFSYLDSKPRPYSPVDSAIHISIINSASRIYWFRDNIKKCCLKFIWVKFILAEPTSNKTLVIHSVVRLATLLLHKEIGRFCDNSVTTKITICGWKAHFCMLNHKMQSSNHWIMK